MYREVQRCAQLEKNREICKCINPRRC
jgi:hypothetical protein